ncbi:hypothetical protein ACFL08_04170 [Patescibacteria group bacterium]
MINERQANPNEQPAGPEKEKGLDEEQVIEEEKELNSYESVLDDHKDIVRGFNEDETKFFEGLSDKDKAVVVLDKVKNNDREEYLTAHVKNSASKNKLAEFFGKDVASGIDDSDLEKMKGSYTESLNNYYAMKFEGLSVDEFEKAVSLEGLVEKIDFLSQMEGLSPESGEVKTGMLEKIGKNMKSLTEGLTAIAEIANSESSKKEMERVKTLSSDSFENYESQDGKYEELIKLFIKILAQALASEAMTEERIGEILMEGEANEIEELQEEIRRIGQDEGQEEKKAIEYHDDQKEIEGDEEERKAMEHKDNQKESDAEKEEKFIELGGMSVNIEGAQSGEHDLSKEELTSAIEEINEMKERRSAAASRGEEMNEADVSKFSDVTIEDDKVTFKDSKGIAFTGSVRK